MLLSRFTRRVSTSLEDDLKIGLLTGSGDLTNDETVRLEKIKTYWDFYEGYHWEGIDNLDSPQVTFNYCRTFVNKFVAFELGKGFNIKNNIALENDPVTINDPQRDITLTDINDDSVIDNKDVEASKNSARELVERTVNEYLNKVWEDNGKDSLCTQIGQTKSITGDAWIRVSYASPDDLNDPFEEYPNGRIRITVLPTQYVYPRFNQHDKSELESMLIMYPVEVETATGLFFKRTSLTTVLYKEFWTREEIVVIQDGVEIDRMPNPYGILPFVQIKNFEIAGRTYGMSDLEDLIPLNFELNAKRSDVSEIIDYHAAPITCVYGAKIANLEKGANKVWGGLPKDAKIENLELTGDLTASTTYTDILKTAMCEIGGVPETVLGGAKAISNTSGVALQYMNLPLIDKTRVKRQSTTTALEMVNKMILFISLQEGLIIKPSDVTMRDFLNNTVTLPDTLPKDELLELQKIQIEMMLGLECRHGAMERLNKDSIKDKIEEIDKERAEHPELFNPALQTPWYNNYLQTQTPNINSGMGNGESPIEQMRVNTTGQNGGAEDL